MATPCRPWLEATTHHPQPWHRCLPPSALHAPPCLPPPSQHRNQPCHQWSVEMSFLQSSAWLLVLHQTQCQHHHLHNQGNQLRERQWIITCLLHLRLLTHLVEQLHLPCTVGVPDLLPQSILQHPLHLFLRLFSRWRKGARPPAVSTELPR